MKTKKEYKRMKAEIVQESAINVGYYNDMQIPLYAIVKAVRNISEMGYKPNIEDIEIENMLITEAIKELNFQDFKAVAPYFFNF